MNLDAVIGMFTSIPLDWIILGALVVLIALDSLRSGIGRACAISLALPAALLLFSLSQKAVILKDVDSLNSSPMIQLAVFGIIALACYLLARRMALEYIESGTGEPIQALLAGGAATVVLIVVWLQLPMTDSVWHLSDKVHAVFSESYRLVWLLGAYLGLAFARG